MKGLKIASGLIALLIAAPIWYYLVYTILSAIHPDRLVWFLFWIYVPMGIIASIFQVIIGSAIESKK